MKCCCRNTTYPNCCDVDMFPPKSRSSDTRHQHQSLCLAPSEMTRGIDPTQSWTSTEQPKMAASRSSESIEPVRKTRGATTSSKTTHGGLTTACVFAAFKEASCQDKERDTGVTSLIKAANFVNEVSTRCSSQGDVFPCVYTQDGSMQSTPLLIRMPSTECDINQSLPENEYLVSHDDVYKQSTPISSCTDLSVSLSELTSNGRIVHSPDDDVPSYSNNYSPQGNVDYLDLEIPLARSPRLDDIESPPEVARSGLDDFDEVALSEPAGYWDYSSFLDESFNSACADGRSDSTVNMESSFVGIGTRETLLEECDIEKLLQDSFKLSPIMESGEMRRGAGGGGRVMERLQEAEVEEEDADDLNGRNLERTENAPCRDSPRPPPHRVRPELYSFEEFALDTGLTKTCRRPVYPNGLLLTSSNPVSPLGARSRNNKRLFVHSKSSPSFAARDLLEAQETRDDAGDAATYGCKAACSRVHKGRQALPSRQGVVQLPGQLPKHVIKDSARRHSSSAPSLFALQGTAWALDDDDDDDDDVLTSTPPSRQDLSPSKPPPQLYYTTPPRSQMTVTTPTSELGGRLENSGSANRSSLSRIARRLSHKERRANDEKRRTLRQRSISLDCGEKRRSLDGPGDHLDVSRDSSLSIPASPSLPNKLTSNKSGSSSPNIAGRLYRKTSGSKSSRKSAMDSGDGSSNRRKRYSYDLHAMFEAVTQGDSDRLLDILTTDGVDVNSLNDEELSPLDTAVMCNRDEMARLLLAKGARENPRFTKTSESRLLKLITLVNQAEKRVSDLRGALNNAATPGGINPPLTGAQLKELERQLTYWELRYSLRKQMKANYDQAKCPDEPVNVHLNVSSSSSLLVRFDEPLNHNGALVTRYKVEWSRCEDFSTPDGEQIIDDPRYLHYEIPDLTRGQTYYARVYAWNIKGFGKSAVTSPSSAVPSCWREVDDVKPRLEGKVQLLDELFSNIRNARPADAPEIKGGDDNNIASPMHSRKSAVRKSIKSLFSSAPKFQKCVKRGVYMSCLICHEDKVVVTNEDVLPIIEVDENYNSNSLQSDIHWLLKIACTWEDIKALRHDLDKSSSAGTMQFRGKLLNACAQLQSALGLQHLGQFYHQPIRDTNGSIILTTVKYIRDPKLVNSTNVKWTSLSKVQRRMQSPDTDNVSAHDLLLSSAMEYMNYSHQSVMSLPKGLYVGYLKLRSSVDLIRIMVPEALPNVLPYVKLRDCPNVTREEWQWLRSLSLNQIRCPPTPMQTSFQSSLSSACKKLLEELGVNEDEGVSHRIYDLEVAEMSEDVTFILVLPPVEGVCSVPGCQDDPKQVISPCSNLPMQVFEMINMCTYLPEVIRRYTRTSSILEMDIHLAQQAQREAFSSDEIAAARQRTEKLNAFQTSLEEVWKGMRWTKEIITYARDKSVRGGLPLSVLYAPPPSPTGSPCMEHKDLDHVSTSSDMASSTCSDCGYHSDISSIDGQNGHRISNVEEREEIWFKVNTQPGILRIYAAYESGLARGASVKLQVTPRTTSREVIHLVVEQLNKAVVSKGSNGPIYLPEEQLNFCLVAVIGSRERVLRDDYQPLNLQNPWTKGRLYVRLKSNLLAAIEHGHVTTV